MRKTKLDHELNIDVPRHGWKELHFFVRGHSVCGIWNTSIQGYNQFDNGVPVWKTIPGGTEWPWATKRDCPKCIRIWLELYYMFRENRNERLFP